VIKKIKELLYIVISLTFINGCAVNVCEFEKSINLSKYPWKDYEKAIYEIYRNGKLIGTAEFQIQKKDNNYEIKKVIQIVDKVIENGGLIYSNTLMPLTSYYKESSKEGDIDIKCSYDKDNWRLKVITPRKKVNTDIKLPKNYYENATLLYILRSLNFSKGQIYKINVAVPANLKVIPFKVSILDVEKVKTPYKETDCVKIKINNQYAWYSNDDKKYLYQYKKGEDLFVLRYIYEK